MEDAADDFAETCQLLERLQAGDAAAFKDLCERHRPLLVRFLRRRFDPQLRARADPSERVRPLVSPGPRPGPARERTGRARQVRRVLARLPTEDRDILLMRTCFQLSYGAIATLLNVPPPAARQRYGRALVQLSRLLSAARLGESDV